MTAACPHVGSADVLGARTVRPQESIPGGLQLARGLPNLSMFQNHPVSHSVGLGGAQALPFSHTFRYDAGAASSGVTRKPVAPLLPDSGCRAGGLAGKESTTVTAGFIQGCNEAHHWFLHVLPLWMLSLPTKPMVLYHQSNFLKLKCEPERNSAVRTSSWRMLV